MIGYMFAESSPVRAVGELRCDHVGGCDEIFTARGPWDRASLRTAAAREAAWTQDEVGRDHCGTHRSTYAAQHMQKAAEATYSEARPGVSVTAPDGIPVAEVLQLPATTDTGHEDQAAADKFGTAYSKATVEEERRRAYREAGALTIPPPRGKHRGQPKREEKAPKPQREPLLVRLGLISREPLDLPDDAPDTDDPDEWLKPFNRGDTRASWEMASSWIRRGWLRKRRKTTTDENTDVTGVAA